MGLAVIKDIVRIWVKSFKKESDTQIYELE